MHGIFKQDVDNAYPPPNWRPRYNYFDGTQLINSFLGLIVLPYERFSNLRPYALEQMMANDHQNYRWISDLIDNLYTIQIPEDITNIEFIYSTYWHGHDLTPDSNFKVGNFWRHLRNAFAHSGDGTLFFFPISDQEDPDSGTDVTHIGFFDHVEETDRFFLAKLSLDNVKEIAKRMESIIHTIEDSIHSNTPFSFEDAINKANNR